MKNPVKTIEKILGFLEESKTVCVIGHVRPDGDCVGSQLGLALALASQGKSVCCWNQDGIPAKLAFLDPDKLFQKPKRDQSFDCVVALDAASLDRLGEVKDCIQSRRVLINIDHHESNTRYGDVNWISDEAPSTGELVFALIQAAQWRINPVMANCLFAAISTDTGSFQYPSTRPATFHAAGALVELGADLGRICHEVYHSFPLSRVRLLQRLYRRFRLTHQNQTAYFWLRRMDYAQTGAGQDDSEGLIDHLRSIEPVVVACLFEEIEPELTRISLRSKVERINVSDVAGQFGGGGHQAAAGARIPGAPRTVQRRVLAAVRKALAALP